MQADLEISTADGSSLREQLQQVKGELKEAHSRNQEVSTQLKKSQDEVCLLKNAFHECTYYKQK